MEFGDIANTVTVILAVIGGLLIVMNFIDKIKSWLKPGAEKEVTVNERLRKHDEMLAKDQKRIEALESDTSMILQTMLALIDHEITGNSIENLKHTKENLTKYLVER